MRAKLLKASVIFAVLAILLGMPLLLAQHRIRPANFALIERGMTEPEVEKLLGAKAGDYDGYRSWLVFHGNIALVRSAKGDDVLWSVKTWASRHGAVAVWFDERHRVDSSDVYSTVPVSWWASLLERVFPRPSPPPPPPAEPDYISVDW